jgi:hypothetical protein
MLQSSSVMNNIVGFFSDQLVRGFVQAYVFSTFEFDAINFIDFTGKILTNGFNGFWTFLLSLIFEIPRSKSMLKLMQLSCRFEFGNASVENIRLLWFEDVSCSVILLPLLP